MNYKKEFAYKKGQIINKKLQIVDCLRSPINNTFRKGYKYKCLICENQDIISEYDLKSGKGCNVCAGKKILQGYNDLWTTNPKVAQLLKNKDIGYQINHGSHQKLEFICNECGKINLKCVKDVVKQGFSCQFCSDNISIPEKFLHYILSDIQIDFNTQQKFKWSKNKRYDVYISSIKTIMEINGMQHYEENNLTKRTLQEEQENDKLKEKLAKENGIVNYITIDARYSELEYIKQSILNSQMAKMFDLDNINWNSCFQKALKSRVVLAAKMWESGLFTYQIAQNLNISTTTIQSYLKKANDIGLCIYDKTKNYKITAQKRYSQNISGIEKTWKSNCVPVKCITTNENFKSINDAITLYPSASHIGLVCKGLRKTSGKNKNNQRLKWEFINEK